MSYRLGKKHNVDAYTASDRGAEYCDERVCVFVGLRSYLRNYTSDLWQFLGMLPMAVARLSSVKLRISGFMDVVIFEHKLRLLEVTVRLMQ